MTAARGLPVFAATLIVSVEMVMMAMLATDRLGGGAYLACHLAIAATAAALAYAGGDESRGPLTQLAVWTAAAGPFGALIGAVVMVDASGAASRGMRHGMGEWLDDELAEATAARRARLLHAALHDGRLRIEGAADTEPLVDVFAGGSQEQKFAALGAISRRYAPPLSVPLRLALRDSDASVRVLASTVMGKLQHEYAARCAAARQCAEQAPHDPALWKALAEAHTVFAASGLLESSLSQEQVARAKEAAGRAVSLASASDKSCGQPARDKVAV